MDDAELASDCKNCIGLYCVAPPFAKSNEFAFVKAEGEQKRIKELELLSYSSKHALLSLDSDAL